MPKIAKKSGVRLVVRTVTGIDFIFSSNSIFAKVMRPFYRVMQKRTIMYTDAVIFQNTDDKEYFEKYNLAPKYKCYLVASPGRYQCLAQAIQPDKILSRIEHAATRTRNLIRETKNQWTNLVG